MINDPARASGALGWKPEAERNDFSEEKKKRRAGDEMRRQSFTIFYNLAVSPRIISGKVQSVVSFVMSVSYPSL